MPALASSIDMIEPTTPLPTTTTSTAFSFVFDISVRPAALDDHMLWKAFRVDRHLTGLHVKHADGFGVVRLAANDQVTVVATGHTGEPEQFPAHFVTVAAVQRIGEVPFVRVAPQQVEEEL